MATIILILFTAMMAIGACSEIKAHRKRKARSNYYKLQTKEVK